MKKIYLTDEYVFPNELIVGEKYLIVMKSNDVHVGTYYEYQYFKVDFYHDFDNLDLINYVIKHDEFIKFLDKI